MLMYQWIEKNEKIAKRFILAILAF